MLAEMPAAPDHSNAMQESSANEGFMATSYIGGERVIEGINISY